MDQAEAIARLHAITRGIDCDVFERRLPDGRSSEAEESDTEGWWETSTGAQFGAARLAELEDLVRALTE